MRILSFPPLALIGFGDDYREVTTSDLDARSWLRAGLAVAAVGWGAQQFAPLLLLYQSALGLSTPTVQGTFGFYVLGLIPGLLLGGPVSDRFGRRRVMAPTLVVSALATILLILGGGGVGWLFAGRLLSGIASGAAFSSGAAWIKELSVIDASRSPRRITVAMSIGFGLGPLVSGVLAQWAPAPTVVPYLPHLLLTVIAFAFVFGAPETQHRKGSLWAQLRVREVRDRRFLTVVIPLAPWVFGSVSIAVAYLPGLVKANLGSYSLIFSTIVTVLCAAAGIAAQPLARWVDHPRQPRLLATALGLIVVGVLIAAASAFWVQPALVILTAIVLGSAYGCCQVCGLREVQRISQPERLAGLTAAYQAVSYLGFAASYPLSAAGRFVPAGELLLVVAFLAVVTLLFTTFQSSKSSPALASRL